MERECRDDERPSPAALWLADEPAEKSYRGRVVFGVCALLLVGLAGAGAWAYYNVSPATWLDLGVHRTAPASTSLNVPVALPAPIAAPLPTPAAAPSPTAPAEDAAVAPDTGAAAFSGFPQQPIVTPPAALSSWSNGPAIPEPVVSHAEIVSPRRSSRHHNEPAAPRAVTPLPDALPTGSALHLQIVYTPADATEASRIDALANHLRSEVSDVASASASTGPTANESVVYFFSDDRAGARRIAASLARITKRAEPVMLAHANPLPRPGTVEIRLPLQVGKDLKNEGS